ncbi:type I-C CRISPR-associated protein Cas8c/Csd1 [Goodfellowiella coeruleoviolacea]|uniref:CRISPR-associated protein Csd1 n=1 Tax=Goodfellowiella coeruleoviolacea TaxID=334858 RepID=A0AAE3GEJ8_9PSEU|nr:type I-C CRISPR-associated protein Cas8c/Csd1 [Goodfellowiella coeruleoviolacea]MCP2166771.1 CRISPR-associated protein Csd1 [Goodfellowiella coeruleoviolacea]
MLVKRLVDHAASDPTAKPFHRSRQFHWQLRITPGQVPSLETLVRPDAKGRPRGADHVVPAAVRTVGVAPNLAADDVQYVLGWADETSKPERVAQCHAAFVELVERWAASPEGQHDPIARELAGCYRSGLLKHVPQPDGWTSKQGVLITVDEVPAYQAESVVPFWTAEVTRRKGGGVTGLCLVCGKTGPLLDTVPGKVPSRLVPGATNDAALISVNERVFGYDLTTQLGCSPICVSCGEAVSAGLVRVLDSPHTASYGGQDSRLAWWFTGPVDSDPMELVFTADPDDVNALLRSVHSGKTVEVDTTPFCSLTVGGNVARVMVRGWLEMPLGTLKKNIAAWFADHEVSTLHPEENPRQSHEKLVRVTGRWLRAERRYAFIGAKGADRPDRIQRDLLQAAIRGRPLPTSVLPHLLHRVRTDGRLDTARAALIRLALVRSPLTTEKPMPELDRDNRDAAYLAGRIFATLEAIQYDVSDGKLNTTYGDRYFAGAITNPRAALVNGRKDANAWLRKLRRTKKGASINHEKQLDELFGLLTADNPIPSRTSITQQSMFLLGYHHQRADRFAAIRANKTKSDPSEENPE